ncbi:glycosyltransferase family 4 protein [Rhodocytophaga rosea]|uniref:Glycosyltransferase family 4 protein n=1 Tax=Rhodocytophaga rosea TaxID=2704465 RepID=A0A6C0GNS5_9BACT|nr:glycosyltransferase family 4 protein [Rhodocytophaga rosea]QHT69587.1 glycosyltransferase family 4 protein [Rhodocytophaga rosea]
MKRNLAIIAPNLGARSETFIQRHMQDLLPGKTVVIASSNKAPLCGHWSVNAPVLIIEDLKKNLHQKPTIKKQLYHAFLYKMGLNKSVKRSSVIDIIENFLITNNVGVILSEYLDFSLDYIGVARKLNIPFFAHAHGYDVSLRLKSNEWRIKYLALNEVDGVILMNEYSKKALKQIGIKAEKLFTIPYGVQLPEFRKETQTDTIIKCLAVGRMVAKKAPILLLDSFRRALEIHPNLHLDFIGTGELLPAVKQYIQAFRLQEKVSLHGALDNELVLNFMQQADIFLQHSITCPDTGDEEGMPVAILEAMSYSLPVISTFHSGIPEAVIHSKTGFLVNEYDVVAMAEKIALLAENQILRINMGLAGREYIKEFLSWEKEKTNLLKLLLGT